MGPVRGAEVFGRLRGGKEQQQPQLERQKSKHPLLSFVVLRTVVELSCTADGACVSVHYGESSMHWRRANAIVELTTTD